MLLRTRYVYIFGSILAIGLLAGGLALSVVAAQEHAQTETIDLYRDDDGDGHPDEFVEAMRPIMLAAKENRPATDPDVARSIEEVVARLHYSQRTLDLQDQAATLMEQYLAATSEAEAVPIREELARLEAEMMTDPAYARAQEAFEAIMDDPSIFEEEAP